MAAIEDRTPKSHDLIKTILSSDGRDFLVRCKSDQAIKISELTGKTCTVGLYFSASWCGPCRRFTPKLIEVYNDLHPNKKDLLEVVLVSADRDEESFNEYLAKMPWLAIPYSDGETRDRLYKVFEVKEIPRLVIVDAASGKVVSEEGVGIVGEFGSEGYPFTEERIKSLKDERVSN